ncbi:MAG TPA: hypothetical protein VGE52_19730, partial [Pirellulales bacterium]
MFPSWAIWMLAVAQLGSPAEDVQTLRDRIEKHRSDGDYSAAVQDALKLKTLLSQTAGPDSEECRDCEFDLRYLQAVERLGEESLKFAQFQIMASETDDALAADAWEAADAGMATLLRIVKPTAEPGAAAKLLIWRARMNVMQENFRGAAELESLARAELGAMGIGKGKRAASLDSVTRDCLWDRGDYAQLKAFVPNSSDGSLDQTERFYQSHDALNLALACGDSEAIPSRLDEYRTASKALDIPNAAGFVLRGELLVALYWGRTDDVERIGRRLAALPEAEKVDTRFAAMHVAHQWEAAGRLADALDVWESVLDLAKRSYDGHDPEAESRKAVLELLGGADNDVWGK